MINDKASLVQIPSGYKSGTLYSVVPNTSAGDFTVTGDPEGEATRVNKDGLIESVAADVPRLNYDPSNPQDPHLLLEPTRSNLIVRSEEFNLWGDTGVTVTENATTAPTGAQTADLLTSTANNWRRSINFAISNEAVYSFSCFVKKHTTTNNIRFELYKGTSASNLDFEFTTKTITASDTSLTNLKVENYTNDWYRVSCKFTANGTNFICYAYPSQGYSSSGSAYFWGAQLEAGSYPTSYIPTSGSAVTRTKDTCINGGDDALFNDSEGVLFADLEALGEGTTVRKISLSNGSTDFVNFNFNATSGRVDFEFGSTSNSFYIVNSTGHTLTDRNKIAIKYKSGDTDCYINGTRVTGGNGTFTLSGLDRLNAEGRATNGTQSMYAKIHQLMVFNEALTDSELITLTS